MPFGPTDCSVPMTHALEKNLEIDVFIVYTDSETYYGNITPIEALKRYRRSSPSRSRAKLVVMGLASNGFSLADPDDPFMLDLVGFDTATPEILGMFLRGELSTCAAGPDNKPCSECAVANAY